MRYSCLTNRAGYVAVVIVCGAVLTACENQPATTSRAPESRPSTTLTEKPVEPDNTTTTPTTQPALPEWLEIVASFGDEPGAVDIVHAEGRRLVLDTRAVRRLHIDRARLPLHRDRSIVLILDGQGIEWRANSTVDLFERSENGVWTPVKPSAEEDSGS